MALANVRAYLTEQLLGLNADGNRTGDEISHLLISHRFHADVAQLVGAYWHDGGDHAIHDAAINWIIQCIAPKTTTRKSGGKSC